MSTRTCLETAVRSCTDRDLLHAYLSRGITDIVSVPCSITDTFHAMAADEARRGALNLVMTSHEGNLAGIAGGIWFGTGRPALVHMQNSGLPNAGDGFISFADPEVFGIPMAAMVTFPRLNLLDAAWDLREPFDAIFCRNVMIYFDKPTQAQVLARFMPWLKPDGLLFAGHSENFTHSGAPLRLRGQTVYERVPG